MSYVCIDLAVLMSMPSNPTTTYMYLHHLQDTMGENFYHSYAQLAKELGISIITIKRHVKELEGLGLINHTQGNGYKGANRFTVLDEVKTNTLNVPTDGDITPESSITSDTITPESSIKTDTTNSITSDTTNSIKTDTLNKKQIIKNKEKETNKETNKERNTYTQELKSRTIGNSEYSKMTLEEKKALSRSNPYTLTNDKDERQQEDLEFFKVSPLSIEERIANISNQALRHSAILFQRRVNGCNNTSELAGQLAFKGHIENICNDSQLDYSLIDGILGDIYSQRKREIEGYYVSEMA